jgi:D-alanyl-D-alanine carboxypeptidase
MKQQFLEKLLARRPVLLRSDAVFRTIGESHAWLCNLAQSEPLEAGMMNPRRFSGAALLYRPVVLACALVWLAFGSARIENTGAMAIVDRYAPALPAAVELAAAPPRVTAINNAAAANAEAPAPAGQAIGTSSAAPPEQTVVATSTAAPAEQIMETASDTTAALDKAEPTTEIALADSSQQLPAETPPLQAAKASTPEPTASDTNETVSSIETVDECLVLDTCVDRYLWALYQRTPKEDTIKVPEQRRVTVKRRGRMVTVTRTYTRLVNEDFAWKDLKAAERAGISLMDYVIGGVDRDFKLRLFQLFHAAEATGLSPGITSAFRDDYRQSIANGLKAASDRSYHGGSFRGGYGHGLAADVVSVSGATRVQRLAATENFWRWIDEHGKEFGIGRPYLDKDPPHLAPIDGEEYAKHNPSAATGRAEADLKTRKRLAVRDDHLAKHQRTARSSKVKTI